MNNISVASETVKPVFTVPGLDIKAATAAINVLQDRLCALIDLALTLKHVHWNVVGPQFIGVHKMLDPQVAGIQAMVDTVAERISTLGGSPNGLAGYIVSQRTWNDYPIGRDSVFSHLSALDTAYCGVNADHRGAIDAVEDAVSEDLLTTQLASLELYQWFVRAHLESSTGELIREP